MILEEWIQLLIPSTISNYYRNLGYILDIPVKEQKHVKYYQVLVHIDDIPKGSTTIVTKICDECGKIVPVIFGNKDFTYCSKCANILSRNPQYKCIDCNSKFVTRGKLIDCRCKKCHKKYIMSFKNMNKDLSAESRLNMLWSEIDGK